MIRMLTYTVTHLSGDGSLTPVASGIACTPIDPVSDKQYLAIQGYPQDKLFSMRQAYTYYPDFANGDYLEHASVRYAVRQAIKWYEQGAMATYYQLLLELVHGS